MPADDTPLWHITPSPVRGMETGGCDCCISSPGPDMICDVVVENSGGGSDTGFSTADQRSAAEDIVDQPLPRQARDEPAKLLGGAVWGNRLRSAHRTWERKAIARPQRIDAALRTCRMGVPEVQVRGELEPAIIGDYLRHAPSIWCVTFGLDRSITSKQWNLDPRGCVYRRHATQASPQASAMWPICVSSRASDGSRHWRAGESITAAMPIGAVMMTPGARPLGHGVPGMKTLEGHTTPTEA
ncbi:hypothetical protein LX32DRAFT_387033 [Colletotrichum zoysiae]|uniref:Uncharacterized protein n=1 Tax=Colletotrichum zoysiae TaxID=1216348 RepID=A0AAD9M140_9PEZI|nr:hypothetical protein LX32DRAFT_387033 [Colletotrichum zoysiae]